MFLKIFLKWIKELNPFWIWLKELTFFQKEYDSKNWTFLFEYDAKNWTFFWTWLERIEPLFWIWFKELNLFLSMTQKIELFFFWIRLIESNPFFECDSNWNFGLKNSQNKIHNWFFFHMTRRIEPAFSIGLKDLMLFSLKQRIELSFLIGLTELDPFSWIWLRELNFSWVFYMSTFFKNDAENWTLLSLNVTSRIWIFLEYDAKNWTLFLFDAKKRTFISLIWMTPRIVFFKQNLNQLNFLKYDSQNWTFEPCVKKKKDSENGTLLKIFCWNDS